MNVGDTFIWSNANDATPHLWIVITEADGHGDVVIVNITSLHTHSDTTCCLFPGDHPFVRHDSVVNYQDGNLAPARRLRELLQQGLISSRAPGTPSLLIRIRAGASKSEFVKPKVKLAVERCAWQAP